VRIRHNESLCKGIRGYENRKFRKILECLSITTISHPNILPRIQCLLVRKGLLREFFLSMHPDHKRQLILQPIPKARLQEFERTKSPLIFHRTQHKSTADFSQLEIFRDHLREHSRARHKVPQPCKWILVKGGQHAAFGLGLHCDFEERLLYVKR
jgi:hypothetical protein